MTGLSWSKMSLRLLAVSQLYFGFGFSLLSASLWPLHSFVTQPNINPPVFNINRTGTPASGYIFMDTNTNGFLTNNLVATIIDSNGSLIWQATADGDLVTTNPALQSYNGQDVITYWEGDTSGYIGRGYGKVVILDTSYNQLYNVTLESGVNTPGATYESYIDAHESLISSSGTLLATVYNITQADLTSVGYTKSSWILDSVVVEIDIATNEVLWTWSSADHTDAIPFDKSYEPITSSPTTSDNPWDYFHINAIAEYGEGYLISARTFWSIYYVSKSTGEVIWEFNGEDGGDFTLPSERPPNNYGGTTLFQYQHDSRVASTSDSGLTITLFDNNNFEQDNILKPNSSYGLQITLNTDSYTSTLDEVVYDTVNPVHTIAEGNRQTLSNGNIMINYGFQPYMKEFDSEGNLLWSANWGILGDGSYRGRKYGFTGTPETEPSISIVHHPLLGYYAVYVSWLGSTEVQSWQVDGCGDGGSVTFVKSGFETEWKGDCESGTARAIALTDSGVKLSASSYRQATVNNTDDGSASNSTATTSRRHVVF